jgi:uncharacterized SAM-binding protein YcdF (DUF218 family)
MTKQDDTGRSSLRRIIRRLGRVTIIGSATLFALQMVVASSGVPQEWLEQWLFSVARETEHQPRYVVVIGGSIPGEEGLMHTYYAAEVGRGRSGITFIIAMPVNDDLDDSSAGRMRDELVLRGIPASDILFETRGVNTYEQAVFIGKMLGDGALGQPILIVTSPLHIRRTFLCFHKQGFTRIACLATHPTGERLDLGPWVFFRYTFWYRLKYQAMIARELTALAVYKLRGWI